MKLLGTCIILLSTAGFASALVVAAPEIDSSTAVSAVGLVIGGLLIARSRRK